MQYEGIVYRPPSEAQSLIIQATIGCAHNTCVFCSMYRGKKFRVRKMEDIKAELIRCADEKQIALVLTTGGTGFSPRDITPEATMAIVERPTPGIPEAMRAESMRITPKGCLSRSVAGIRNRSLIITLPGSKKASAENILAVIDPVAHGLDMLYSEGSADCAK